MANEKKIGPRYTQKKYMFVLKICPRNRIMFVVWVQQT